MRFLVGGLLLVASAGAYVGASLGGEGEGSYYPMGVGSTWHYKGDFAGQNVELSAKIAKVEKIDGIELARLEVSVQGRTVSSEHLRLTDKGIFRHRIQGMEITPPLCLVKFPIKDSESWGGAIKTGNDKAAYTGEVGKKKEMVEVAAGKFQTVKVTLDTEEKGQKIKATYWFAKDVGVVKQQVTIGENVINLELQKYEAAKVEEKKKDS